MGTHQGNTATTAVGYFAANHGAIRALPGPDRLRGFWNKDNARGKLPCISRPDLVAMHNRKFDRANQARVTRLNRLIKHRERGDCGVRALAACADIPYAQAKVELKKYRCPDGGIYTEELLLVLQTRFDCLVRKVSAFDGRTMRTLSRKLSGTILIKTTAHFAVMHNGVIYDYAAKSLKRVREVYRITNMAA